MLVDGTVVGGRYTVGAYRGSGGSSDVYRAIDGETGASVAIKIVRDAGARTAARLERELTVARTIEHPNVVRMLDSGVHDGRPYLVMEFIDGPNLAERIREQGLLTIDEVISIATQTLRGLAELHDRGVIHRDIKPSNLLLAGNEIKIADLGLAKRHDSITLTSTNEAVGTWAYIAPEQALARAVDHRADLFSLGVLLYECLAGRIPYADRDTVSTVVARLHHRPRNVAEFRPDTPSWLADIVTRLLAREPDDRYRDARAALDAFARKQPRRPWLAIAVTALLCLAASVERPVASQIETTADGLKVFDARSRMLWSLSRPTRNGICAAIIRDRHRSPRYIAVGDAVGPTTPEARSRIGLYDPSTGRLARTLVLPDVVSYTSFGGFSNLYSLRQLTSIDIDGADLLAATYIHEVFYPSCTVVWDFEREVTRLVFYSAGHHHVIGAKDVNHDGRADLLTIGISNKLGWYAAVAAVDVPPVVLPTHPPSAQTPDRTANDEPGQALLWYKLLPPAWVGVENATTTDRDIQVQYPDGRRFVLSDNGFLSDHGDVRARQAARQAAYEMLARANRASGSRDYTGVVQSTAGAVASATASGDEVLTQWAKRQHAVALIATGDYPGALSLAGEIVRDPTIEADACYDIARAFHLRHDNERAVEWYARGLRSKQPVTTGRLRSEFLENAVFALVENAEWTRARELIAEYRRNYLARPVEADLMRVFVDWRERGTPPVFTGRPDDTDFVRYLRVVFARMSSDPRAALPLVAAEAKAHRSFDGLVRLVYADLLQKNGRSAEAAAESAAACNWLSDHADDPLVRALHATCAR